MISVVMPTHQLMPYMDYTVIGVICQDYDDYEFIVVDASETRYFHEYIEDFKKRYPKLDSSKIRIYEPDGNITKPGAMKMYGFRQVTCSDDDYVLFLDHDDFIPSGLFRNISEATKDWKPDMISGQYVSFFIDSNGNIFDNGLTYMKGMYNGKSINTISIGKVSLNFSTGLKVYDHDGDFTDNIQPTIFRKSVLDRNAMTFITDTDKMDDAIKPVLTPFLSEIFINAPSYVYCAYENIETNSVCGKLESLQAINSKVTADRLHDLLAEIKYRKCKVTYTPIG